MKFKLIFKESFQYFKSKAFLFFTFIPFLFIVISLIVGLFSFAYNFQTAYDQSLGNKLPNFKLYTEETFKPAWVDKDNKDNYYLIQEKVNPETNQGYFYDFMVELWKESDRNQPLVDPKLLILGIGYHGGYVRELTREDLLTNKLLKEYFKNPADQLKNYNQQVKKLSWEIFKRFQTDNLVTGYFLKFVQENDIWLSHSYLEYPINVVNKKVFWQYLIVSPDLISSDPSFYQETPWTLRTNPANPLQVQKQVNWKKYPQFLKDRNFVYFSPKFLHDNHLKIGQVINLNFFGSSNENEQEFLIAGSLVNSNNFDYKVPVFFVPYQWIVKYYHDHFGTIPHSVRDSIIFAHVPKFGNDTNRGQKFASDLFNHYFENIWEPGVPLQTEVDFTWLPGYAFKITVVLFLVLAYFISCLLGVLLTVVFYFITKQIIEMQQKTLMFLKSLGVSNNQLSVLITATLFIPFLFALFGGFFGGLLIQKVTADFALETTSLYWDYFSFNSIFFLAWIFSIIFLTIIFYFINLKLIKKQSLIVNQGSYSGKTVPFWWTRMKLKLPNFSSKFIIGLSFAFKNLKQNFVTYLLLTCVFSVTLYSVQFKTSLDFLGRSYEKWNAPFQSVNYNSQLYLYSSNEKQQFLRSYETRTNIDDLIKIDSFYQWDYFFDQYLESLIKDEYTFNWQNFYLTKSFSLEIIELLKDEQRFDQTMKKLENKLKIIWSNERDKVEEFLATFLSLTNQIKDKINNLQEEFNYKEGFDIFFGQLPLLSNTSNVWASESFINDSFNPINLIAFAQNDQENQKHFGFNNCKKISDYIQKDKKERTYLRVNISNYLAMNNNYYQGQFLDLTIKGLKSDVTSQQLTLPIYVEKIIQKDNVTSEIYTSQEGLIYYLTQMSSLSQKTRKTYENLLSNLNNGEQISNSVYDKNSKIPWGIQHLTLPLYHNFGFKSGGEPGTRIEDFYDSYLTPYYFDKLGSQIIIFSQVSQKALQSSEQFIKILNYLIAIFIFLAILISAILINLFLFENQKIIVLLKSIGYLQTEVEWYLIAGYLVATLLAIVSGIGFSFLIFELTKQVLTSQLGFSIYFIWNWRYILTFTGLGLFFWFMIKITISVFAKNQKPIKLFEEY